MYEVPVISIVLVIALSQMYKIPPWLIAVPVAFALFTLFKIETLFFNEEKTGLVSRGVALIQ